MPRLLLLTALLALHLGAHAAEPVRPQDDLFLAANGDWLARTEIPPERSAVFGADLPAAVDARLQALLDDLQRRPARQVQPGSPEQQLRDFHAALLDTAAIERAGLAPLRPLLREIAGLRNVRELAAWQGRAQGRLQTPIWLWGGFADFRDPDTQRVMAWQGGLGLPDRAHYLDEQRFAPERAAYRRYLTELARLAGMREPAQRADRVLALETRLAAAHVPAEQARDPARMLNPLTPAELQAAAPGFDWPAFAAAAGLPPDQALMVTQRPAAVAIARLHAELPLQDWRDYLSLRSLDEAAPVLPAAFRAAHFAFHGQALGGAQQPQPRAQQALAALRKALPEPLARLYVQQHFPPAQREQVQAMVGQIVAAYRELLQANDWLSPAARREALAKLEGLRAKVGHPAQWRDTTALQVRAGDALGNRQRAQRFDWERHARANGQPVDRAAWAMSPLEANAFYDPMQNEINLPAAHLQAPWFEPEGDDAEHYGALGALIAHEIGHAFDPLGAQFDATGRLRPWWTEADRAAYEARCAQLVAQAEAFEPLPGQRLNGRQTLAENAADLSGLQAAFTAFRRAAPGNAEPAAAQRFFLSYARSWRAKFRPEALQRQLAEETHAPHAFRANGAAQNLDAFHEAFGTRAGDRMYKPASERIRLW
ncbi:M13 family metallopeptidase [Inhella proteolytica]|uniref:M13 family metallopeptidase n=1 Tax=Inhella proteolytica TaxID=2795029 RepID=A0A931J5U4_9BURK|nr:M13 family metallopeptidase [Inhella proteolytica]MBH9576735.1 M13 family metallopeptidase [Inhella proteolytica]